MPAPLLSLLLAFLPIDTGPQWLPSIEEAQRLAQKTKRPIFVVFRCEH